VIVSSHLGFSLSGFLTGLAPELPLEALALSAASDFCDSSTYSSSFACSPYLMNIRLSLAICCLVKHRMIEWYELIIHDGIKTTDKDNTLLVIQLSDFIGCKQFPS